MPHQTVTPWACYLALLQAHPTIHGLYLDACRARGTASHRTASQRYHAAVAACPVLREARDAWLASMQAAWTREAALCPAASSRSWTRWCPALARLLAKHATAKRRVPRVCPAGAFKSSTS